MNIFGPTTAFLALLFLSSHICAQAEQDLGAMQRQLNAEVMEKPFSVEDEAKIDAYVKEAMAKDLKPEVNKAPSYWRPGYTCRDIYGHGWRTYRNCRYYRRYHGHYWR